MKPVSFYLTSAFRASLALPLYALAHIIPRDPKQMIIGAWQGKLYCDNPKYFMLYVLEHTDYKVTWIGNKEVGPLLPKHPNLRFAVKNSPKAIWAALRAKTWIYCWGMYFDLCDFPIRGRALVINLFHGIPLKYIGRNSFNGRHRPKDTFLSKCYLALLHLDGDASYFAASSDKAAEMFADGLPSIFSMDRVIKSGTPRNDFLINNANNNSLISSLKKKYAALLGFDPNKRLVTYLPTHRNDGQYTFAFFDASSTEQRIIKKILDANNAVLFEKHHFLTLANYPNIKQSICSISIPAETQRMIDVQELLLITDILICDYTSAYYDFSLLHRPILHYAYDLDHYTTQDSGIAFPINEYAGGPIATKFSDFTNLLSRALTNPIFDPKQKMKENLVYEKGNASETILQFIKQR